MFSFTDKHFKPNATAPVVMDSNLWPQILRSMLVISINPERLQRFMERAGCLRGFITHIHGVNGRDLSITELQKKKVYKPVNKWNVLTRGQLGCFMSHRKAWSYVISEDLPYAFILEDDCDVHPNSDVIKYLTTAIAEINFTWDILYISRNPALCKHKRRVRPHVVETGKTWGLFAYVVTKDAAAALLAGSTVMCQAADIYVSTCEDPKRKIALSPMVFGLRDEESDTMGIL